MQGQDVGVDGELTSDGVGTIQWAGTCEEGGNGEILEALKRGGQVLEEHSGARVKFEVLRENFARWRPKGVDCAVACVLSIFSKMQSVQCRGEEVEFGSIYNYWYVYWRGEEEERGGK